MYYLINFFWVCIGITLYKLLSFRKLQNENKKLEKDFVFNLKFWIYDNWRDVLINFIFSIVIVFFFDDIITVIQKFVTKDIAFLYELKNVEFMYFVMGYVHQSIIHYLRHTTIGGVLTPNKK